MGKPSEDLPTLRIGRCVVLPNTAHRPLHGLDADTIGTAAIEDLLTERPERSPLVTTSASDTARIVVVGPASWNHLIELEHLPAPTPHMEFARRSVHTLGGTSAGKALHLNDLGAAVELHSLIGDDADGRRIRDVLREAGVTLRSHASSATERHVNLMTPTGERISIYISTPSPITPGGLATIEQALTDADIAVLDLSDTGVRLLERHSRIGWDAEVWVDLHDYDGISAYHQPFLSAADVVFMNADRTRDPWALLSTCVTAGPHLAVCTLGADGAIAMDLSGTRYTIPAAAAAVVDTNGAGDAFMAGFLHATTLGRDVSTSLAAAAQQATAALSTVHMHPVLTGALGFD